MALVETRTFKKKIGINIVFNNQKVIGIMGSGQQAWAEFSIPLARWIAEQNYHLLTGGGEGVMAAASQAFCQVENRTGLCIGIIPTKLNEEGKFVPYQGYPNSWVELNIVSPLPRFDGWEIDRPTRNQICVLSSDIVVALPGSKGTKNEVDLAILFDKPIILFGEKKEFKDFPLLVERTSSIDRVRDFILARS